MGKLFEPMSMRGEVLTFSFNFPQANEKRELRIVQPTDLRKSVNANAIKCVMKAGENN